MSKELDKGREFCITVAEPGKIVTTVGIKIPETKTHEGIIPASVRQVVNEILFTRERTCPVGETGIIQFRMKP